MTLEELKALEEGDQVWVMPKEHWDYKYLKAHGRYIGVPHGFNEAMLQTLGCRGTIRPYAYEGMTKVRTDSGIWSYHHSDLSLKDPNVRRLDIRSLR